MTSPWTFARKKGGSVGFLGNDHINWFFTEGGTLKTLTAQFPWLLGKGKNLQPSSLMSSYIVKYGVWQNPHKNTQINTRIKTKNVYYSKIWIICMDSATMFVLI